MPKQSKVSVNDLLIYIYKNGPVRAKDLEQAFVHTKQLSRGTLYKYKRLLEQEGKIQATPVYKRPLYNIFSVPEQHHQEVEVLKQLQEFSKPLFYNTHDREWVDAPKGYYLTDVKQKILWHDNDSGAMAVLIKLPPGISETVHYHPYANQWGLGLYGESEQTDGTLLSFNGTFSYMPQGEPHAAGQLTKESMVFIYWDGPRTKISI
jgi:oxalate decarboxylase/phosphoglucose isomerase-like protein (cupin superfamily)